MPHELPNKTTDVDYSMPAFIVLVVSALAGLYASAALVYEKIAYWELRAAGEPTALGCDINPIVGCGNVLNTPQASIIGSIPNPILGVIAFAVFLTVSSLLLLRVDLPKWCWLGLQAGVVVGIFTTSYLQYESIFVIGALCPWCMVVWFVTTISFWVVSAQNIKRFGVSALKVFSNWNLLFILLHVASIVGIILLKFGETLWA